MLTSSFSQNSTGDFTLPRYPWLANAHSPVWHRVYFVPIHIFLLFIHLEDRQNHRDIFAIRHITRAEISFQIADVSSHIRKLFPDRCLYLLFPMFPIDSWQKPDCLSLLSSDSAGATVDHMYYTLDISSCFSFASFNREISCGSRILAGAQITSIARGSLLPVSSLERLLSSVSFLEEGDGMAVTFMGKKISLCLAQHIVHDPFAEQHKGTCIKWQDILISRQSDKILEIWLFCNLFYKLSVGILEPFLDNQGTQRCTQRLCNIPCIAWKKIGIFFFKQISGDRISRLYPTVIRIHFKSHRLVEIEKGCLCFIGWLVYLGSL